MRTRTLVLVLALASTVSAAESPAWVTRDLKAGIIGTDTSHVPAFTGQFESHPEWRIKVVAAFKGGSPDLPTGQWKDGRIGIYYGPARDEKVPVIRIWGTEGTTESKGSGGYEGLVRAIAAFFHTGKPPVNPAETIEIFEFMTAAQRSKERAGADIPLAELRK